MGSRRPIKSIIYMIIVVILTGILVFSGYQALKIYIPQSEDSDKFEQLKKDAGIKDISAKKITEKKNSLKTEENIRKLAKKNRDFVGWLSIEDTVIDYPVMKSSESDPEFYLHRNFDKKYSFSGTLFIGEGCNADSDAFVIYGHNMNAGTMFGSLDDYKDADFAYKHQDIVFRTTAGNRVYRVFASFQTKIYSKETDAFEYYKVVGKLNKGEYKDVLNNIRDMSLISTNETPKYPAQIMFLSTCHYHTNGGRFVVAAYRII